MFRKIVVVAVALLALGLFAVAVVAAERSVTGGAHPGRLAALALLLLSGALTWFLVVRDANAPT